MFVAYKIHVLKPNSECDGIWDIIRFRCGPVVKTLDRLSTPEKGKTHTSPFPGLEIRKQLPASREAGFTKN